MFLLSWVWADGKSWIRIAGRMWQVGSTEVGCNHEIGMDQFDVVGGI